MQVWELRQILEGLDGNTEIVAGQKGRIGGVHLFVDWQIEPGRRVVSVVPDQPMSGLLGRQQAQITAMIDKKKADDAARAQNTILPGEEE